nr:E3 ubiquitin-protein ligase ZNRF1 isoform X3 [Caretta caretta]
MPGEREAAVRRHLPLCSLPPAPCNLGQLSVPGLCWDHTFPITWESLVRRERDWVPGNWKSGQGEETVCITCWVPLILGGRIRKRSFIVAGQLPASAAASIPGSVPALRAGGWSGVRLPCSLQRLLLDSELPPQPGQHPPRLPPPLSLQLPSRDDVLTKDAGECVICLEELLQGDTIARLPCLCIYHKSCIDSWFEVNRSCPEHPSD